MLSMSWKKQLALIFLGVLASATLSAGLAQEGKLSGSLAAITTVKDGNIPKGFQNAGDVIIYDSGRIEVFGSKSSLSISGQCARCSSFSDTPEWHSGQVPSSSLAELKAILAKTKLAEIKLNTAVVPPSASDGPDRVADFTQNGKRFHLPLWQIPQQQSIDPLVNAVYKCKETFLNCK